MNFVTGLEFLLLLQITVTIIVTASNTIIVLSCHFSVTVTVTVLVVLVVVGFLLLIYTHPFAQPIACLLFYCCCFSYCQSVPAVVTVAFVLLPQLTVIYGE